MLAARLLKPHHPSLEPPLTPDCLLGAAQTLNEEAGIAATLQHLRGMHPPPHEIIVVDAASDDRWASDSSSMALCVTIQLLCLLLDGRCCTRPPMPGQAYT